MQDLAIKSFGTKLMVASKSINNIPDHFLSYSQNARIFDGGIGPRRGKQLLKSSTAGTKNMGGFELNGNLYQVANSKVYLVDLTTGDQTDKGTLGFDAPCDCQTYSYAFQEFVSIGAGSDSYGPYGTAVTRITYNRGLNVLEYQDYLGDPVDTFALPYDARTEVQDRVRIMYSGTTASAAAGTGTDDGSGGYRLQDEEYMLLSTGTWTASTATRTANNTFTIAGDVTATYATGRSVRWLDSSVQRFGTVLSSSYSAPNTTVTIDGEDINTLDSNTVEYLSGASTLSGTVSFQVGNLILNQSNKTLIASASQNLFVFDGTTLASTMTAPINSGIIEAALNYTFLAVGNVLYISVPVDVNSTATAYDFYSSGSKQVTFSKSIRALKATMNGLYVFTDDRISYLSANSLQNVAGSATWIATPIGDSSAPVSNQCVAASGDKIFWISKNMQVMTLNYTPGVATTQIGELSARPVVSIKEFLDTLDPDQASAFAFYNENDKTIQFSVASASVPFNDKCLVYDLVNDTWNIDTGKNYNRVVKVGASYYGLSDVNSSVYIDDVGFSDAGMPIGFKIVTQEMIQGTFRQKQYGGMFTQGSIGPYSVLQYSAEIDGEQEFSDTVTGASDTSESAGDIGGGAL
jgi:hypothetical protein